MLDFDKLLVIRRNFGEAARAILGGSLGLPGGNYRAGGPGAYQAGRTIRLGASFIF